MRQKSFHTKKQKEILLAFEKLAKLLDIKISAGKLDFAGLKLKGGDCLLRGEKWLVLDKRQAFDDQVDIYSRLLTQFDWQNTNLPANLLELVIPYLSSKNNSL